MIQRFIAEKIKKDLFQGKIIMILGARQTGKTTLINQLFEKNSDTLWLNGDIIEDRTLFEKASLINFRAFLTGKKIVIIDEAQRIEDIGLKLKIIKDGMPEIQLVVTGSSSFELANAMNEPLTGRKFKYNLYPLSFNEMVVHHGFFEETNQLENRLIYGYYPEILMNQGNQIELLKLLTDSYLYKDILEWGKIKKTDKIIKILQALAFQIGNQVSYNELSKLVGLDNQTVENYIQLLEKSFVIFRLNSFSRNLRSELKTTRKIYFYDLGIRNALINNFNPISLRDDVGALWENFMISERKKYIDYHHIYTNLYFWRTQSQQEIDLIEERGGMLYATEFKWNENKRSKIPAIFLNNYPDSEFKTITPKKFYEFIYTLK
jgi:predicted AAA+ superfamily ATPase